jgi:hypothetical protein
LHDSLGGVQLPQPQVAPQRRLPVEPQLVVHEPVEPRQQLNPSSHVPSQSSSVPLQVSAGGLHPPHEHAAEHVRDPVVPQDVTQLPVVPEGHAKPSSTLESQSSSTPLHVSEGGAHMPHVQLAPQVREPLLPQLVVQLPDAPATHSRASSIEPSQSSSALLQASGGGAHAPQPQAAEHVREPVVPQLVVHGPMLPRQHENPSSQVPSQSSSVPLQVSTGGLQLPHMQLASHVRDPGVPQLAVQPEEDPATQV